MLYVLDYITQIKLVKSDFPIGLILIKVINGTYGSNNNNSNYLKRRLIKPIYCNLCIESDNDYLSETLTLSYSDNFIDCSKYENCSIKGLQINPNGNELQVLASPKITDITNNLLIADITDLINTLIPNIIDTSIQNNLINGIPPELI